MQINISSSFFAEASLKVRNNQFDKRTLYPSLGIEMPLKISSSFFAEASWKVKNKSKREDHIALKISYRFFTEDS